MTNQAPAKTKPAIAEKTVRTPVRPAAFKIVTPKHRKRHLKLLVYGGYGVGKTTLAGTASLVPSMQDVLLIDAESGDLSLDQFEGIDAVQVSSYKEVSRGQEVLKVHCKARDENDIEALCKIESHLRGVEVTEPRKYNTVIVDSLAEVETYCMYQLLGVSDSTRLDEEVQSAEWSEYKRNHNMIKRLVRAFRDLPMNVIMTCPQNYIQDETKKQKYSPALTGKLSTQIQGFMDMVGYLVVGTADDEGRAPRRLYVQPSGSGRYDAKNRFASFKGNHFDDPTMQTILEQVGLL